MSEDTLSVSTTMKQDAMGPSARKNILSLQREDYDGVSCRPIAVSSGPKGALLTLRLQCKLDALSDRIETRTRWFGVRGLGLADKIARHVRMGGFYRHLPVVHAWRTPTPIVAPIFIVGSDRSGTTILGKVLGHQGDVLFLNEARPIWYRAVPDVDEGKFHWREGVPQGRIYLDESDFSLEAKVSLERAFGWLMRFAGRDRVMEKLPINLFRVRWLRAMWPGAMFIQIIRDPFSTAASKNKLWPGVDSPGVALRNRLIADLSPECGRLFKTITNPYERQLLLWRTCTEEGERLKALFPDRYYIVRLEDVQRSPEEVLRHICDFVDLRFTNRLRRAYKSMLDPCVRLAKPELDRARCRELLGESPKRWGYEI